MRQFSSQANNCGCGTSSPNVIIKYTYVGSCDDCNKSPPFILPTPTPTPYTNLTISGDALVDFNNPTSTPTPTPTPTLAPI